MRMNDTLYIIGNGFDLHHGLNTSYSSFRDNCAKKTPKLWKLLTVIYGDVVNDDMWWSRFEEMLANIHYNNLVLSHNGIAMAPFKVQNLFKGSLPPFFGQWVRNINHETKEDESLNIDTEALFFTFNYTLTLEKVYHVKPENVWHIHGSINDVDNIVVGHDSDERKLYVEFFKYRKEHKEEIGSFIADGIIKMAAEGAKKIVDRIANHREDFIYRYQNIKHIIIMGFSFNDIDRPYIKAIMDANKDVDCIDWTIYYHEDGSDNEIIEKLVQMGVKREQIKELIRW